MSTVLTILTVIVSILLIIVVLIQKSKGGGLASSFAQSNQIMGVRRTTDFVEKATWTLAIIILFLSVFASILASAPQGEEQPRYEAPAAQQTQAPDFQTGLPAATEAPAAPVEAGE